MERFRFSGRNLLPYREDGQSDQQGDNHAYQTRYHAGAEFVWYLTQKRRVLVTVSFNENPSRSRQRTPY